MARQRFMMSLETFPIGGPFFLTRHALCSQERGARQ